MELELKSDSNVFSDLVSHNYGLNDDMNAALVQPHRAGSMPLVLLMSNSSKTYSISLVFFCYQEECGTLTPYKTQSRKTTLQSTLCPQKVSVTTVIKCTICHKAVGLH